MRLQLAVLLAASLTAWSAAAQLPLLGAGAGPTGTVFSASLSDSVATTTAIGVSNGLAQVINVTVVTSDTVTAAIPPPQGMGDIASGFTEWHSIGDAYTSAYAAPGTNLSATGVVRSGPTETCNVQVAATSGPGNVTSCSGGSSGVTYDAWAAGGGGISIQNTTTLTDQTGNGHGAIGCNGCPGSTSNGFTVNTAAVAGMPHTFQFTAATVTNGEALQSGLTNFGTSSGTLVWRAYQNVSTFNDGTNFYWFTQAVPATPRYFTCGKFGNNLNCGWLGATDTTIDGAATASSWPAAGWHLYAVRWDTTHTDWLVDGVVQATNSTAPAISNIGVTLNFGGDSYDSPQRYSTYSLCEWGFNPTYISDANLASMATGTTCH